MVWKLINFLFPKYIYSLYKPKLLFLINYQLNNNFFTNQNKKYKHYNIWNYTYWKPDIYFDDRTNKLIIWRYCCIAENVQIMMWWNHNISAISTYPFPVITESHSKKKFDFSNWNVCIGNDVRIWRDVTIMSWVTIWDWAVIALWSVVTKDVESYSIVGWIPAKIIKYRFTKEKIETLLENKRWKKDLKSILASGEEDALMS